MIRLSQVCFRYPTERFQLRVPSFDVDGGESVAVVGPSGCGKTTLLRLIAGILRPNEGTVRVLDSEISALPESGIRAFRIQEIGLVFQEFELLDYLTARDNILLPYRVSNVLRIKPELGERIAKLAEETGISHLLEAYPRQLSQGERQRVAICRALLTEPKVILADEPTGSLDPQNQSKIVDLLVAQAQAHNASLVMVTHDHGLLASFDRSVDLPALIAQAS